MRFDDKTYRKLRSEFNKLNDNQYAIKSYFEITFESVKDNFIKCVELASVLIDMSNKWREKSKKVKMPNFYEHLFEIINEHIIITFNHEDLDYYFKRVS